MDASSIARGVSLSCTALGSANAGLGGVPASVVLPPPGGGGGGGTGSGVINVITDAGPDQNKIEVDTSTGVIFNDQ